MSEYCKISKQFLNKEILILHAPYPVVVPEQYLLLISITQFDFELCESITAALCDEGSRRDLINVTALFTMLGAQISLDSINIYPNNERSVTTLSNNRLSSPPLPPSTPVPVTIRTTQL